MRAKRFMKRAAAGIAMAIAMMTANAANAATINVVDWGGVAGSRAERDLHIAANYWGAMLTNDAVINLGVNFYGLGGSTLGQTNAGRTRYSVSGWEAGVNATKSNSLLDQKLVLPTLNQWGNVSFITNGLAADGSDDSAKLRYVPGDTYSSNTLYLNTAIAKAIGKPSDFDPNSIDGHVVFSSDFKFDFNPSDGIAPGSYDFLAVAIHEFGHVLGFISGVDYLDIYSYPNGQGRGQRWSVNNIAAYDALDMFRYSEDVTALVPGNDPVLDVSVGTDSYFSIDGGKTALFDNAFSTGARNGDGQSASHWKNTGPCNQLGLMDTLVCSRYTGRVTALDLAAFDAIGWNTAVDVLANPDYVRTTAQIYAAAVPEPATWLTMILGCAATGIALRRRPRRACAVPPAAWRAAQ